MNGFQIVFGGGRRKFLRKTDLDHKTGEAGDRTDHRNLIQDWENKMKNEGLTYK